MKKLALLLFSFLLFSCVSKRTKYQARWMISNIEYRQDDKIHEYLTISNMTINFDTGRGMVPSVYTGEFIDENNAYDTGFDYMKKEGKEYIIIQGSKFFTDTWEVNCLNDDCCRISLSTSEKYVELAFNGEVSDFMKRRACPPVWEVVDWINPPYPHNQKKKLE